MPKFLKPRYAFLLAILPVVLALFILFPKVILQPNTHLLGHHADALKNYYTPWYHAKYDSTWHWFQGMNYPYGDHVVFADAQPLLSNGIRAAGKVIPSIPDHTVGIMNYVMFLQIIFAALLLWRILLRFHVETRFAALSAAAIAILSPQLIRMGGHFALSYAFVLPLLWWLTLRAQEKPTWGREALVGLALFLVSWLHPYFLMVGAIFLTALWGVRLLMRWREHSLWRRIRTIFLSLILPGILFFLLMRLSDPVTDRPANPYGFQDYVASWRTVFLPLAIPKISDFTTDFQTISDQSWEGLAYVGAMGTTVFLFSFLGGIRKLWRHRKKKLFPLLWRLMPSRNLGINVTVIVALLLLLFAMGFPFGIKPDRMTELFPLIKQFRSLGRFAWVFYYLWMVYVFYALYRLHRVWRHRYPLPAWGIVGIAFITLFAEGFGQLSHVKLRMPDEAPLMTPGQRAPWLEGINPHDYSSAISLPWFHAGGENIATPQFNTCGDAFATSIQTGLPLLNVMMSRTSQEQTWEKFQMATEPAQDLEILKHLPDRRPALAIRSALIDTFDGDYLRFGIPPQMAPSKRWIYPLDLFAAQAAFSNKRDSVPPPPPNILSPTFALSAPGFGHEVNWDQDGDAPGMFGTKGKRILLRENNFIFKNLFPDAKLGSKYTFSVWAQIRGDLKPRTLFGVMVKNQCDGDVIWSFPTMGTFIRRMEGDWALCEREVQVNDPLHVVTVNITRWSRLPVDIIIDEFHIRPSGTDAYRLQDSIPIRKNNRELHY